MFKRFLGAFLALLISGLAWSAPCAPGLPDRSVPLAGEQWTALLQGGNPAEADHMAMFPEETVHAVKYRPAKKMADRGFDHLLGMWNAATAYPCDRSRPATIEFHEFELVRLDPKSGQLIVAHTLRFDGSGPAFAGSDQYKRQPMWFVSGLADHQPTVSQTKGGAFVIDLKSISTSILHGWTNRIKAEPGQVYGIRAKVRITGDARLQLAMDYWRGSSSDYSGWSPDCVQPTDKGIAANNCEAWLGSWIGDTKGQFVTIIAPRSLLVNAQ